MPTITTIYTSDLRTQASHVRSGAEIITDAPVDNQGKGEAFSPSDLLAASLGSCMLTIMGIAARNHNFSIDGTRITIDKIMVADPRRVSEIRVEFFMPSFTYTEVQKKILQKAAEGCPVALSIHPDITQKIAFHFE